MAARRIAILGSRGIPAKYGGFETFAQEISWRLAAAGFDVTVYCENEGPSDYRGVHLEYVPTYQLGPLSTIAFDVHCLWRARKSFDVVYMLGYGAALFCFLPRLWGASVWINMDGIEWLRSKWSRVARFWLKSMERVATQTATRLIVDAERIADHMRSRYRSLPPMTMIPYGVIDPEEHSDEDRLRDFGVEAWKYCLIVCRLEPENHVLEIIEGYRQLDTGIPLIVVGGHEQTNAYIEALLHHESSQIRFVGGVYDADRLWALRMYCAIYFHGHSVGGTNPSLLEAMAAGNVIIAHDNPFNREVLADAGQYFARPDDVATLARENLQLPVESRRRTGADARARIDEHYTWNQIRDSYLKLLADT